MAHSFDSVSVRGLRLAHIRQLSAYLEEAERDGWYYGRKDQFDKRHDDLKSWINGMIEKLESGDYRPTR